MPPESEMDLTAVMEEHRESLDVHFLAIADILQVDEVKVEIIPGTLDVTWKRHG